MFNNIQEAVSVDSYGFTALYFEPFLNVLKSRVNKSIETLHVKHFMSTLGSNKSGGNNGISRLQYFLNAFIQEAALKNLNNDKLAFVGNDHYYLARGGTGTNDPDFYFYPNNGKTYTIDVKIYWSDDKYYENISTTNFHNADYCLAYIINTKTWKFSRKCEYYAALERTSTYYNTDPWLSEIALPQSLFLIRFFTDELDSTNFRKLSDYDLPEKVKYEFY